MLFEELAWTLNQLAIGNVAPTKKIIEHYFLQICPSRTTTPASEETTTTVTTLEMPEVTSFGATTATTVTDTSMVSYAIF